MPAQLAVIVTAFNEADRLPATLAAVKEPAQRPPRRAVLEVELDLGDPVARPRGVDVHRRLHPEARREGQQRGQECAP